MRSLTLSVHRSTAKCKGLPARSIPNLIAPFRTPPTIHAPKDLVACFSHADTIRLLVAHYLMVPLDHFQRLGIDTASITVLSLDKDAVHFGPISSGNELHFEAPKDPVPAPPQETA